MILNGFSAYAWLAGGTCDSWAGGRTALRLWDLQRHPLCSVDVFFWGPLAVYPSCLPHTLARRPLPSSVLVSGPIMPLTPFPTWLISVFQGYALQGSTPGCLHPQRFALHAPSLAQRVSFLGLGLLKVETPRCHSQAHCLARGATRNHLQTELDWLSSSQRGGGEKRLPPFIFFTFHNFGCSF